MTLTAAPAGARGRALVEGLLAVALVVGQLSWAGWAPAPVQAAGTPNITLGKSTPPSVLYGSNTPVTLTVGNPSGPFGYNLGFRDVLPAGVSYVAGSTVPAGNGDPTVIANQPAAGQTTLVWTNLADISQASTVTVGFSIRSAVEPAANALLPGASFTDTASAYVNTNPRIVPSFDATGQPVPASFTGSATASATTTVAAFSISKAEPSPEGKLMRGLHDHQTVYTLVVTNDSVKATNGFVVDDYLPAAMEFLGCGTVDNTSGGAVEYAGSGPISGHTSLPPAQCPTPTVVETLNTDPDGPGPLPAGVYTHVRWTGLGNLAAGATLTIKYVAAIPLRSNVPFPAGTPTSGIQTANLGNNTGPETTDHQAITNYAVATGTYTGTLAPGTTNPITSAVYDTVTGQDLAVTKTVSDGTFAQGKVVTYTLLVRTSEYRYGDNVVVTDTLPNGLCPKDNVNHDAHGAPECAPSGPIPSPPYTSVAENANGTFTLIWNLGHLSPSANRVITFPAADRANYQQNGANSTPTVAGDTFTNTASVTGTISVRCAPFDPDCTQGQPRISHDRPVSETVTDTTAAASQSTPGSTLTKQVSVNTTPLSCGSATYLSPGSAGYPPTYQKGDRICFRVHAVFPSGVNTRNPVVTDFIPPNSTYETGSATLTGANTVTLSSFAADPASGQLTWQLGSPLSPPNGSLYIQPAQVFDAVFSVLASADPTIGNKFDITANLVELVTLNTAGAATTTRASATYQLAAPILRLLKGVESLNGGPSNGPNSNVDNVSVRGGDNVIFRIDVTNTGVVNAFNPETWDVLPPEVTCADISAITPASGVCSADIIKWPASVFPIVTVGGIVTLTYAMHVPLLVAAGEKLSNTAGVRTYAGHNNASTTNTYYPQQNIDPSVPAASLNAPPTSDPSAVIVAKAIVAKTRTTDITTGGNGSGDATIGEGITYTVAVTVPHMTSIYSGDLSDPLGNLQTYVANSGIVDFPDGTVFKEDGSGQPLPRGFTYTSTGNTVHFTFPAIFSDNTATDEIFTITFRAIAANVAQNSRGTTIVNKATLNAKDSVGRPLSNSGQVSTNVVEPAVSLVKTVNPTLVQPGGSAVFTIVATHSSVTGTSSAFNLVVTDPVPPGLTYVPNTATLNGAPGGSFSGAVLTWTIPGPLDPGASATMTFGVNPVASSQLHNAQTFTNTANDTYGGVPPGAPPAPFRTYHSDPASAKLSMDFPALGMAKSTGSGAKTGTAFAEQPFTWRLTISNRATVAAAQAVTATDTLPPNWSYNTGSTMVVPPSGPPFSVNPTITPSPAGDHLLWSGLGTIGPGQSLTLTFAATPSVAARTNPGVGPTNPHINSASATAEDATEAGGNADGPYVGPTDTATALIGSADLNITKSHTGNFVAGSTGTYTIGVHNAGPSPSDPPITVTDLIPPGQTFVSATGPGWTCGPSLQGVTCTLGIQLAVNADAAPITLVVAVLSSIQQGTILTNAASVDGRTFDPNPTNNTTDDPTTINALADLVMRKSHTGNFTAGQNGVYTLSTHNNGPSDAAGPLSVTDTLPAGMSFVSGTGFGWTCSFVAPTVTCTTPTGLIAGGDAPPITLTVSVASATPPGTLTNTATVHSPTVDPVPGNNTATDPTVIGTLADVSITKVHQGAFVAGQHATYAITVHNAGPSSAARSVVVTDPLPAGVTVVSASSPDWSCTGTTSVTCAHSAVLGAGADSNFTMTVALASGITGSLSNTASVTSPTTDPNHDNNHSTDVVTTTAFADLSITKTHTGSFTAGTNGVYTLQVHNGGPSDAAAPVTVTDTLPAGTSFVSATGTGWSCSAVVTAVTVATCTRATSLVAGTDAAPITLTVHVASSVLPQTLVNTATVQSPTTDPDTGNNTATDPTQVVTSADLSIVKSHTGSFTAGAHGTYTLQVHNAGPSDAAAPVTVTDPLPAGMTFVSGTGTGWSCVTAAAIVTCTRATSLASGADAPIALIVAVDSGVTGSLTNTAGVTSPTSDPNPSNNHSSDPTTIATSADISIVKTHLDHFTAGTQGDYTLQVHNAGPSDAALPLTVTDNVPAGMTYVNASGTDWTCGAVLATVTCHALVPLHAGADAAPIILTVAISASQPPGTLVNHASVVSATTDPNPGNNSSEDPTTVVTSADLVMSKHHSNPLVAGMQATYILSARNNGPSDAAGPLQIVDTLPAGTTFVSATGPGWTCVDAAAVVTCTTPTGLALGATSNEIDLTLAIASSVPGSIANTATVTSSTPDPDPANNTAIDAGNVNVVADLILAKTHGVDAVVAGTQLTYTLGVRNEGPSDSGAPVVVTDALPNGESFVSGTGAGWSCAASSAVVTCTIGVPVPAGADAPALLLTVAVSPGATGTLTNSASVTGPATDPDPDNNHATDPVTVTQLADLTLTKQLTGTLVVGEIATYLLTVGNLGPSDAAGPITVTDQLPNGLSYVSSSGGSWSCTSSGQTVTCSQSSGLAVGAETSLTLDVRVSAGVGTSLTNHATVSSPTPDGLPDNSVAAVTGAVEAASVGPLPPNTGQASAQPRWRVGLPLVALGFLLVVIAWGGPRRRRI